MAKILIVDDDKDILELVTLLLTAHYFTVLTMQGPEEILEKIKTFAPDIILMDVKIGNHDGRKICKNLKSDRTIKHIPVILFSSMSGLQDKYPECNANGFIAKPFDTHALIKIIEKHLQVA